MTAKHQPTEVTRAQVESLSSFGIPQDDIAREIGIDPTTLRIHYRDELDLARSRAIAKVAGPLLKAASDPNHKDFGKLAPFWLRTQGRWKETSAVEVTGADGGAVEVIRRVIIDPANSEGGAPANATDAGHPDT